MERNDTSKKFLESLLNKINNNTLSTYENEIIMEMFLKLQSQDIKDTEISYDDIKKYTFAGWYLYNTLKQLK